MLNLLSSLVGEGGIEKILSNPTIVSMMASMGSKMDPEGVGGILGSTTQETLDQAALAEAGAKQQNLMQQLIEAITTQNALKSATIGRDGEITLQSFDALGKDSIPGARRVKSEQEKEQTGATMLDKIFQ